MKAVRILIADDQSIVRRSLRMALGVFNNFELVGEACNGSEALALCAEKHPHVVLMDVIMPEMDGIAATRLIRERFPDVQVVALSSDRNPTTLRAMMDAGACRYLFKQIAIDELAKTITDAVSH
ncbi:MAG: response regulator transcription factor [Anaerolineae bacterium]|nr:response regulator transcription factor [Anaerolineae bacterium]